MPNRHTKKLWKWFSFYIRVRDANDDGYCVCPTCGHIGEPKKFQAGHVFPKGSYKYRGIEFDERNVYAQCAGCNNWRMRIKDTISKYEAYARKLHGDDVIDNMLNLSLIKNKYTLYNISVLEQHYMDEANRIAEEKRIVKWWYNKP